MLTKLEQEGYIQRKQEWKTKWISLTNKGEDKMQEVFEPQLTFQTSILNECLTEEEQNKHVILSYILSYKKIQKNRSRKLKISEIIYVKIVIF